MDALLWQIVFRDIRPVVECTHANGKQASCGCICYNLHCKGQVFGRLISENFLLGSRFSVAGTQCI